MGDRESPGSYNTGHTMWQHRELIRNLTVADLKNRYQNTFLGFFWSLLSPLLLAVVLYFVFRHLWGREESAAISILVGVMAWQFFASGSSSSLRAIVGNAGLVTRVYVPRHILVLTNVLTSLINSLFAFVALVPLIFILQGHLPITVLLFPVVHVVYFWFMYGLGLILSSLFVYFRDMSQIWEVLTRTLFFASPVMYPLSIIPSNLLPYYLMNPMTQFILIYRDVMVDGTLPSLQSTAIVVGFAVGATLVGTFTFRRLERRFAEAI